MGTDLEFITQPLAAMTLIAKTAIVEPDSNLATIVESMFMEAAKDVEDAGGTLEAPVAQYHYTAEGLSLVVGYAFHGKVPDEVLLLELPPADSALCAIHHGPMISIQQSWKAFHEEINARGLEPAGPAREYYLKTAGPDQSEWEVQLQQPVTVK